MRVSPSERAEFRVINWLNECFGVIIISYAFMIPMSSPVRTIIALGISLFLGAVERLQAAMVLNKKEALQQLWLDQLALRFWLEDFASGNQPNWDIAVDAAKNDLRTYDVHKKLRSVNSDKGLLAALVFFLAASVYAIRIGLGFGLAWLLKYFAPQLVDAIT